MAGIGLRKPQFFGQLNTAEATNLLPAAVNDPVAPWAMDAHSVIRKFNYLIVRNEFPLSRYWGTNRELYPGFISILKKPWPSG
jgi:hypothetical protein